MAVGDIWLRTPEWIGQYDSSGAELQRVAIHAYGDYDQPPTIAHDGESLWTLVAATSDLYKFNPADCTFQASFDLFAQSTESSTYGNGLAVRDNGDLICFADSGQQQFMEVDHTPTRVLEVNNAPESGPYQRRVSIAAGSHVAVWDDDDLYLTDAHIIIKKWDLAANTISTVNADKPGGDLTLSSWNVCAKPSGGFWVSWGSSTSAGFLLSEHGEDGSIIQSITYPASGSLFHSEVASIDLDAVGNLLAFERVYDESHTPIDYYRLMSYAPVTGAATQLGPDYPSASYYDQQDSTYMFLHVQRSFGGTTEYTDTRVRFN